MYKVSNKEKHFSLVYSVWDQAPQWGKSVQQKKFGKGSELSGGLGRGKEGLSLETCL